MQSTLGLEGFFLTQHPMILDYIFPRIHSYWLYLKVYPSPYPILVNAIEIRPPSTKQSWISAFFLEIFTKSSKEFDQQPEIFGYLSHIKPYINPIYAPWCRNISLVGQWRLARSADGHLEHRSLRGAGPASGRHWE